MMDKTTRAAFARLLEVARRDTGQSRRIASFILAWWNATDLGGFDLTDLFAVDRELASDMATVFSFISNRHTPIYPKEYQDEIVALARQWRPSRTLSRQPAS